MAPAAPELRWPCGRDVRGALALVGWLALGCGAAEPAPPEAETRVGANGRVEFAATPEAELVEGGNRFSIALREVATGEPLAGASLEAEVVMRSMGHEAAAAPAAEELGGGRYRLHEVVFSMPGLWELELVAEKGELYDEVGFLLEVP